MFVPLFDIISDSLFMELKPHHIGNLRLVNRVLAGSITKSVWEKIAMKAEAKYRRMVVLNGDTVRVYGRYGKKIMDLDLPDGNGKDMNADFRFHLYMRLDGWPYSGQVDAIWCKINGRDDNLARYVFHNKSTRLFNATSVFITKTSTNPDDGDKTTVELFVKFKDGQDQTFTIRLERDYYDCSPMLKQE